MSSMHGLVSRGKKPRRLGKVEVIERADYEGLELDTKVELILGLIPLGLMHVEEVLAEEVRQLASDKHARKGGRSGRSSARGQPGQRAAGRAAGGDPGAASARRAWRGRVAQLPDASWGCGRGRRAACAPGALGDLVSQL